jgi:hypothetical protein
MKSYYQRGPGCEGPDEYELLPMSMETFQERTNSWIPFQQNLLNKQAAQRTQSIAIGAGLCLGVLGWYLHSCLVGAILAIGIALFFHFNPCATPQLILFDYCDKTTERPHGISRITDKKTGKFLYKTYVQYYGVVPHVVLKPY